MYGVSEGDFESVQARRKWSRWCMNERDVTVTWHVEIGSQYPDYTGAFVVRFRHQL